MATDFSVVDALSHEAENTARGELQPLKTMQIPEIDERRDEFFDCGMEAIRAGKMAAVLLAGGMGTRLGSPDPKGMYDIGISRHVYIFERLVTNLLTVTRKAKQWIHLLIMTSDKNDKKTREFFKKNDFFGYNPAYVQFFVQDMAPTVGFDGKVLLESKDRISTSPNGNGGWFSSMVRCGLVDYLKEDGVEWLNVFGVDNVLQYICDPVFIGATILSGCASGSKVVRKTSPDEKVGVMCLEEGKTAVVEYSEMTDEMRNAKDEDGNYQFYYGVILNYLFRMDALEKVMDEKMTYHIARKKINCIDEDGNIVEPEDVNGCKFELFIFDLLRDIPGCLPFEVVRENEFAPVKNKTGADSVESARRLLLMNGVKL
jgi:UDP-N-acetylglucosamine/UDP-N-acetylgalactosamine diphosphorylase